MFIVIVLLVMTILYGYVGARMIAPFSMTGMDLYVFWTVVVLLAIAPVGGMILRSRGFESSLIDGLLWIGFFGQGLFALTFIAFLIRDMGWATGFFSWKLFSAFTSGRSESVPMDPGRRQFLLTSMNLGIAGVTSALGLVGFFQARRKPSVVQQSVSIRNLQEGMRGLKIAQISDLHVGPTIKADFVQTVVDQVNQLKPDLIFFTGDMVDGSVDHLSEDVEPLRNLESKYGIFFVTGNHEYYSGVERWIDKVGELGMIHLHNEHRILDIGGESLAIAGVTDLMAERVLKSHRSDPRKAVAGVPADMPTILLAHQPGTAGQVGDLNIDLMVCGHTHGGQFIPFNLAVAKAHPYVAGHYQNGDMQVYVNRGTGYWGPPLRLGIPSEITSITLQPTA